MIYELNFDCYESKTFDEDSEPVDEFDGLLHSIVLRASTIPVIGEGVALEFLDGEKEMLLLGDVVHVIRPYNEISGDGEHVGVTVSVRQVREEEFQS